MNWWIMTAAIFAALTTIGHFAVGSKEFLKPMLAAEFDPIPKKVMHCVFHYVSVFLITSTIFLIMGAHQKVTMGTGSAPVVKFIGINYLAFAVWQLVIAFTSGIPKGPLKLFQWIFFVIIGVTALLGAHCCCA